MFHTLSEQMKHDEEGTRSLMERSLAMAGVLALSIGIFALLYFLVVFLE